jgi:hypothetical protein
MTEGRNVVIQPRPFSRDVQRAVAPAGVSVAEIVARAAIPPAYRSHLRVWIDDREVPRDWWPRVRPREGRTVLVAVVPAGGGGGGGGGKNLVRSIALLAVSIAAVAYAPTIATSLFGAEAMSGFAATTLFGEITAQTLIHGMIGASLTMIGSLAVNALIPPPKFGAPEPPGLAAPRYQLTGVQNRTEPYANIPRIFGKRRVYPLMAARPYSEIQGSDEYLRILLCVGWGPIRITDVRIGETPIAAFAGVEIETREGWTTDAALTLFTRALNQETVGATLDPSVWVQRTTQTNTTEIILDFACPAGLALYDDSGSRAQATVALSVQYRATGTSTWLTPPAWKNAADTGMGTAGVVTITGADSAAVRKSGRFTVAAGQYDVRVQRTTAAGSARVVDQTTWTYLKTVDDTPALGQTGLSVIALRIKATGQLNGVPSAINCLAESYLPVWNGSTWAWAVSRNPAWAFADLLRRRAGETFVADARIDLSAISAWATACDATAPNASEPTWTFDGVMEGGSVFDGLRQIAAHARAMYTVRDGKHSVVRDVAQTVPIQHITPRNSFGYAGRKTFVDLPHALRIRFVNAALGYQEDERIVYADGYSAANATRFETVEMPGATSATQVWREGRYNLAVGALRPETHMVSMDIEALRCTLGDYVMLQHDVIAIGLMSARIVARTINGSNQIVNVTVDNDATMVTGQSYAIRVRRADGTSQVHAVQTVAGTSTTLTLTTPVAAATGPAIGDLLMFGVSTLESAPMIVRKIESGNDLTARLTLVDAQPGVWTADTGTIPAFSSYITITTQPEESKPATPTILGVRSDSTALLILSDGTLQERIAVSVALGSSLVRAVTIEAQMRLSGASDWIPQQLVGADTTTLFLSGVEAGQTYQIRVRAISATSIASDWAATINHLVIGKSDLPPTPATFTLARLADGTRRFSWTMAVVPPDVRAGGGYRIRWKASATTDWSSMAELHDGLLISSPYETADLSKGTYWFAIKAVDSSGNESATALFINAFSLGDPPLRDVVLQRVEPQENWPGTLTGCYLDPGDNALHARSSQTWASLPATWSALAATWDNILANTTPIRYETPILDLGADTTFTPLVSVSATGTVTVEAKYGSSADGTVVGSYAAPSLQTGKRYVQIRVSVAGTTPVIASITTLINAGTVLETYENVDTATASASWFSRLGVGSFRLGTRGGVASIRTARLSLVNVTAGWTWTVVNKTSVVNGQPAAEFRIWNASGVLSDAVIDAEIRGVES